MFQSNFGTTTRKRSNMKSVKDRKLLTVEQRGDGVSGVEWASARDCRDFCISVISQPAAATPQKYAFTFSHEQHDAGLM